MGGIAALVLGVLALAAGISLAVGRARLASWPTVSGEVVARDVARTDQAVGTGPAARFEPRVKYRYEVGGQTFTGERVHAPARVLMMHEEARRFVDGLPAVVQVHHDPADPAKSYLYATSGAWAWLAIALGALMALVGAGMLLGKSG